MIQRRRPRLGMTVIELLVATTLAAMLMVVLLAVLGTIDIQRRELLENAPQPLWHNRLADQLTWDMTHASRLNWREGRLDLHGLGSRDFDTGTATHRPAHVVYFIRQIGETSWLLRRETHLSDLTLAKPRVELLCAGVSSITLQSLSETQISLRQSAPVPSSMRLELRGGEQEEPIWNQTIHRSF